MLTELTCNDLIKSEAVELEHHFVLGFTQHVCRVVHHNNFDIPGECFSFSMNTIELHVEHRPSIISDTSKSCNCSESIVTKADNISEIWELSEFPQQDRGVV